MYYEISNTSNIMLTFTFLKSFLMEYNVSFILIHPGKTQAHSRCFIDVSWMNGGKELFAWVFI